MNRQWIERRIRHFIGSHFFKFGIVGTGGYLTDVTMLTLGIHIGLDKYSGQVVAFLISAVFTWLCNRFWTFRDRPTGVHIGKEWLTYLLVTIGGMCINYAAYAGMITIGGIWEKHLFLAVAVGSIAGLMFNFPMAKYLVFRSASTALQEDHASSADP